MFISRSVKIATDLANTRTAHFAKIRSLLFLLFMFVFLLALAEKKNDSRQLDRKFPRSRSRLRHRRRRRYPSLLRFWRPPGSNFFRRQIPPLPVPNSTQLRSLPMAPVFRRRFRVVNHGANCISFTIFTKNLPNVRVPTSPNLSLLARFRR